MRIQKMGEVQLKTFDRLQACYLIHERLTSVHFFPCPLNGCSGKGPWQFSQVLKHVFNFKHVSSLSDFTGATHVVKVSHMLKYIPESGSIRMAAWETELKIMSSGK